MELYMEFYSMKAVEDQEVEMLCFEDVQKAQESPNPGVGGGLQRDKLLEVLHPPQVRGCSTCCARSKRLLYLDLGSAMVEATWDQRGDGHAGQVDKEDDVILEERYPFLNLSSGDVAHTVLEADASVGEVNTGLLQCAARHGFAVIGER